MAELMTPERLAEIAGRLRDVMPGPWLVADGDDHRPLVYVERPSSDGRVAPQILFRSAASEADAQFVCSARDSVPELVAEVGRLRGELAEESAYRRRYWLAWGRARMRALSVGGAADRAIERDRARQDLVDELLVQSLGAQMQRDTVLAEVARLSAELADEQAAHAKTFSNFEDCVGEAVEVRAERDRLRARVDELVQQRDDALAEIHVAEAGDCDG